MPNRYALVLTCLLLTVLLGCGGASTNQSAKKKSIAKGAGAPFGDTGSVDDMRAPSDRSGDTADAVSGAQDIRVPGSEFGTPASQKEGQRCPKGKKGKKCRAARAEKIPNSATIAELMKGIPWGLHYTYVIEMFEKKIRENYEEELKLVAGEVEEDRLRSRMVREINRLKKSYTKFEGKRTGFEGDVIGMEFTHKNGESMLKWDAGKHVEYMFFFNERFWKRVRTFRRDSFADNITFSDYVTTLVNRLGEGKDVRDDGGELTAVHWQNKDTLVVAEDRTDMYGVYSLSFIAKVTNGHLSRLRKNNPGDDADGKPAVSHIVSTATSGEVTDRHSSVIDDYTEGDADSTSSSLSFDREQPASTESSAPEVGVPAKETEKKDQLEDLDLF